MSGDSNFDQKFQCLGHLYRVQVPFKSVLILSCYLLIDGNGSALAYCKEAGILTNENRLNSVSHARWLAS